MELNKKNISFVQVTDLFFQIMAMVVNVKAGVDIDSNCGHSGSDVGCDSDCGSVVVILEVVAVVVVPVVV